MKKPNRAQSMFLTDIRTERMTKRRDLLLEKRREQPANKAQTLPRRIQRRIGNRYQILSPNILSLLSSEHYESAMRLVKAIRSHVLENDNKVVLDLRECVHVDAAAVLKLHAEIELLERFRPASDKNVVVILPKQRRLRSFLTRVGFCAPTKVPDGAGLLALQSHDDGSKVLGNLLKEMNRSLYNGEARTQGEQWEAMSLALNEAMLNVGNHAYTFHVQEQRHVWPERQQFVDEVGPRWWIVGETHNDQLFLALFDKGIGIPKALTKKDPQVFRVVSRLVRMAAAKFGGGPDSGAIKAAMALGVSGTKKSGRGWGLNDISDFVRQNPMGELRIFSNRGIYEYQSRDRSERMFEQSSSIHGTLIVWNVALPNMRLPAAV